MKLLELLVKELPSHGGWPEKAQSARGYSHIPGIHFWDNKGERVDFDSLINIPAGFYSVSRGEYEAAIKQSEWNGEGLPPVGCECELINFFGEDFPEFVGESREKVRIIGNGYTNGCPVAFYEADGGRGKILAYAVAPCFRPIRTKADYKREDATASMLKACTNYNKTDVIHAVKEIYDAIIAHKITGVTTVPNVGEIMRATESCSREDAQKIVDLLNGA